MKVSNCLSGCLYYYIILFFSGAGIFLIWLSLSILYKSITIQRWIPIVAKVEKVEIIKKELNGKHSSGKTVLNTTGISYRYSVNSSDFQGHSISPNDEFYVSTLINYNCIHEKLVDADSIKIFYNPNNFNQSVIVRGFDNSMAIVLLITIFWNSVVMLMFRGKDAKRFSFERIIRIETVLLYLSIIFILLISKQIINFDDPCLNIEILSKKSTKSMMH